MLTVYKYDVPTEDEFTIAMPAGARVLTFQVQHDALMLWALVDPDARETNRRFRLAGTGHPIWHDDAALRFVGTVQLHGGALVFHLFEVLS